MKTTRITYLQFFSICFLLLFVHNHSFGQFAREEQITMYSSRIKEPIKVEVMQSGDKGRLNFTAINHSQYPYLFTISFSEIQNLTPGVYSEKIMLYPGSNNITSFSIIDPNLSHNYRYSISYVIGDPKKDAILDYPYLIPLKINNLVNFVSAAGNENLFYRDNFKMAANDTVYCMRKGYVAAVPGMQNEGDRLGGPGSLEIIQGDGTVMIYYNINPKKMFVKPGEKVFPGEPIGTIDNSQALRLGLYAFKEEGKIENLTINYYLDDKTVLPFSIIMKDIQVQHPLMIIEKEMVKIELKKYRKKQNIKR
jgi:hypothetical protein